jgi:hypothetical protein
MKESCTVLLLRGSLQKWMSFLSASCCSTVYGVPESCHSLERLEQLLWIRNTKHSLSIPCVCRFTSQSKWINFFVNMKWIHVVTLRLMPASVWVACFDEVRNTSPWFPVCSILHPHKGISSHMIGDVVLGGKLPYPMFREFSWLMALKRARGVFVLTTRNISCTPKCGVPIGSCLEQDRNVIPVEPWTS